MHNDINSIMEGKSGKLWFGARGYARVYDGKTITDFKSKEGRVNKSPYAQD
jgi:hypothetical protein